MLREKMVDLDLQEINNLSQFNHESKGFIKCDDYYYHPNEPWIQTFTGKRFAPLNPVIESIDIEDIAHSLSMQCRFSGHTKFHYSVAYHSILVSEFCDSKDALAGLLHDASEAYLVDIPKPLKEAPEFSAYKRIENKMQSKIFEKYGLDYEPDSVKQADRRMLATEAGQLLNTLHPTWMMKADPYPVVLLELSPSKVKSMFLDRFNKLFSNG
jgi:uncharacterized protein